MSVLHVSNGKVNFKMRFLRAQEELDKSKPDSGFSSKRFFSLKIFFQNFISAPRNLILKYFSFELRCRTIFIFIFHFGTSIFNRDRPETNIGNLVDLKFLLKGTTVKTWSGMLCTFCESDFPWNINLGFRRWQRHQFKSWTQNISCKLSALEIPLQSLQIQIRNPISHRSSLNSTFPRTPCIERTISKWDFSELRRS